MVNHFVPLCYGVYGFDHLGHGKSEGEREVIEAFTDYTDSLGIYKGLVNDWQPGKSIFLLGHSLGGLISTCYLLDHQASFKGAVISAPAVKVGDSISQVTILMGKILSRIAPKAGVLALDATTISRDPQVVETYLKDPLVFNGKTPARLAAEILKAMIRVEAEAGTISLPFIVVQGSEDKLVAPDGAKMLYDKAGSADKTNKIYEGLYHEVFNKPEQDEVLKDVESWLAAHL